MVHLMVNHNGYYHWFGSEALVSATKYEAFLSGFRINHFLDIIQFVVD